MTDWAGDDVLIANFRLTDAAQDYEADLVVLMTAFGALVLEVKGSSVWYDGGWIQTVAGESSSWPPSPTMSGARGRCATS